VIQNDRTPKIGLKGFMF